MMKPDQNFDIPPFTQAKLRLVSRIEFQGKTAAEVFDFLGDPEKIADWYLLAKSVKMHPKVDGEEQTFNVEFIFFGDVFEEVLHWDPPRRYVYLAKGDDFPIKDYVARIEIEETGAKSGTMRWEIYYDTIEGEHYQRILPVMLPAINKASMESLSRLIGGTSCEVLNANSRPM
ncbi:MAG: SRPBCC family protein [Rhizobiaceae bacterium]